jgi:formylglycine-generating enzyme required for sulfatase activity
MQEEEDVPLPFTLDELVRLFSLPWFREGKIPLEAREALAAYLPEEDAKQVRSFLMELMQHQPAAEGSLAEQEQQIALALFGYLNSPKTNSDRSALAQKLRDWDAEEADDQLVITELGKLKPRPLSMLLPARYFNGNIPLLGLRRKLRMALVALPLLLLGLMGWWMGRPGEGYEPERIYAFEQLDLQSSRDTARAMLHNTLVRFGTDEPNSERQKALYKAFTTDPDYPLSLINLYTEKYKKAAELHQEHRFQEALDTLDANYGDPIMNLTDSTLKGITDPLNRERLQKIMDTYLYALTVTALQVDSVGWYIPFLVNTCPEQKGLFSKPFLDSIRKVESFKILLSQKLDNVDQNKFYRIAGGLGLLYPALLQEKIVEIRRCMNLETEPIPPSDRRDAILHARFTDKQTRKPIEGGSVLLPGGDLALDSDANGLVNFKFADPPASNFLLLSVSAEGYPRQTLRFNLYSESNEPQAFALLRSRPNPGNLSIKITDTTGCVPFNVKLIASADKPVQEYNWFVTNNLMRRGKEVNYEFQSVGTYTVLLAVFYEDGTRDTLADIPDLTAQRGGNADFSYSLDPTNPLTVSFEGKGLDNGTATWTYGDNGGLGLGNFAAHTYQRAGPYTVRMAYRGPCAPDTVVKQIILLAPPDSLFKDNIPIPEVVFVKGGEFMMGSEDEDANADQKPVHKVRVSDFYVGKYEVTFDEYDAFCEATGREKPEDEGWGGGRRPVINVSWEDATAYTQWLSKETNMNWRLPTEAEWEYAAGGGRGTDSASTAALRTTWAGTNDESELRKYAWYYGSQSYVVGQKQPNQVDLYDMSGNVWEWCRDWYGEYPDTTQINPQGPESGASRVLRGGGWSDLSRDCRVAYRLVNSPSFRNRNFGFRLSREP